MLIIWFLQNDNILNAEKIAAIVTRKKKVFQDFEMSWFSMWLAWTLKSGLTEIQHIEIQRFKNGCMW